MRIYWGYHGDIIIYILYNQLMKGIELGIYCN